MLFAAGMGIGLMFWSVAEPVVYATGVWGWVGHVIDILGVLPQYLV